MTEEKPPRKRRFWKYLLIFTVGSVLVMAGFAWYATTDSFQSAIRRRLITELERVTGGRVELDEFHTTPFRLRADIRNLTIHGRESDQDVPFLHVDRVVADLNVISILGVRFGFHSLIAERPVIHIIVYPDGTTNQPEPRVKTTSDQTSVEQLFALRIARLEVQRGELLVNEQRLPLNFSASDVAASMKYSLLRRHYEGTLSVGKASTTFQDFRQFAWRATAEFLLGRDSLEIKSLILNSGQSQLNFQGEIKDFRKPVVTGHYSASLELGELAAIARQNAVRAGRADVQGRGQWSFESYAIEGKFDARALDWRDDNLNVQAANVSAAFSVNPDRLALSQIEGKVLGGSIGGDMNVIGWRNSPRAVNSAAPRSGRKSVRDVPDSVQRGSVRLRFKGLSVASLKRAVSTREFPLERVRFAGNAEGTVDVLWIGNPRDAESRFTLAIDPPSSPSSQDIPLTLDARGIYRGSRDELELSDMALSTVATRAHAQGTLSSAASITFTVTTTDLGEWEPLLAAEGVAPLPITLRGKATANGNATGRLSDLRVSSHVDLTDFESIVPANAPRPETRVHWDSGAADVQYSASGIIVQNARLVHDQTQIHFDLNAGLRKGKFLDDGPISGSLTIRDGDIKEVLALAGYSYPLSGTANASAQISGTRQHPQGTGRVDISDATAYGQRISSAASDIRFADGEIQLTNLTVRQDEAVVSGSAAYVPLSKTYRINLNGDGFDLAKIPRLQSERFSVAGRLVFTAQGTGTFDSPSLNADLHLRDVTLNGEPSGDVDVHAVTEGTQLLLQGESNFREAQLRFAGTVDLSGDYLADLKVDFSHLDVDPLLRIYLRGHVTGHSVSAGDVQLRGPLRKPRELTISATVTEFSADIDKVAVRNEGQIKFDLVDQVLRLQQFHLVGTGTDLSAHGTAQLGGDRAIDLQADGHMNMGLLQTWDPGFTSSGSVTLNLSVSGVVSDPVFHGQVDIAGGAISYVDLPTGLSELNGHLTFNQNQLQVETLTAKTGGGILNVNGSISYYQGQAVFDLKGTAQEVRLRYPPGISSTTNAEVRLSGTSNAATLSGDLTVIKLAMTPGFDFGTYLERAKLTSPAPQQGSLMTRLKLDLHVTTTPELQMQTAMAKLSGDADLRVRGTAARPVVLGRVDILEGEVFFNGAKYRLERGDVLFTNPVRIEPVLDLEATTRVSDYDVTIGVNGTFDKLNVNYRSEPPLPSADVIALLALGRTREESSSLESSSASGFSGAASNLILSEAINAAVSSRVQRLFGVSRIKIDPQGLPSATNVVRGPQVTIEQQVASNVTVTYSTNVAVASQQIIQLEYNVTRSVSIVALRDQNGVVSFDIKVRRRRK